MGIGLTVALLALVILSALLPTRTYATHGPAHGYAPQAATSSTHVAETGRLVEALGRYNVPGTVAAPGDLGASPTWADEAFDEIDRLPTVTNGQPGPVSDQSSQMHDELNRLQQKTKLRPLLSSLGRLALRASAVGTIGWIGAELLFGEILSPVEEDGPNVWEASHFRFLEAGQSVLVPCATLGGTACAASFPDNVRRYTAPVATKLYLDGTDPTFTVCSGGSVQTDWPEPPSGLPNGHYGPKIVPMFEEPGSGSGTCGDHAWQHGVMVSPIHPAEIPMTKSAPGTGYDETFSPGTTWSGGAPTSPSALNDAIANELATGDYPTLSQWLDHHADPEQYPNNPLVKTVPDCEGMLWQECADLIEQRDLEPIREKLGWQHADVTKPADAVVTTNPLPGSELETGSIVTVTTNPGPDEMPLLVPAYLPNEKGQDYKTRLIEEYGWPAERVEVVSVPMERMSPNKGPEEILWTWPAPGSSVDPQSDAPLHVSINPAEAPAVNPGAEPWNPPNVRAPRLDPLGDIALNCTTFPLGLFCWTFGALGGFGNSEGCEQDFGVPLGTSVDEGNELDFNVCGFEPAMQIIRPVIVLVCLLGLAWLFATHAMGFGGAGNEADE